MCSTHPNHSFSIGSPCAAGPNAFSLISPACASCHHHLQLELDGPSLVYEHVMSSSAMAMPAATEGRWKTGLQTTGTMPSRMLELEPCVSSCLQFAVHPNVPDPNMSNISISSRQGILQNTGLSGYSRDSTGHAVSLYRMA